MLRVLDRLKKYKVLYEKTSSDANTIKRIKSKLPLFSKMYSKLLKKRRELKFSPSFFSKSPLKKGMENESTRNDSKDFPEECHIFHDNISLTNSTQSMMQSYKTANLKKGGVNESFDYRNENQFDEKLQEIKDNILILQEYVRI